MMRAFRFRNAKKKLLSRFYIEVLSFIRKDTGVKVSKSHAKFENHTRSFGIAASQNPIRNFLVHG
jgi:hypothetical protein